MHTFTNTALAILNIQISKKCRHKLATRDREREREREKERQCVCVCENSSRCDQARSVLNGITQSNLPPTRFIPARAEPHLVIYIRNFQQQSPTVH